MFVNECSFVFGKTVLTWTDIALYDSSHGILIFIWNDYTKKVNTLLSSIYDCTSLCTWLWQEKWKTEVFCCTSWSACLIKSTPYHQKNGIEFLMWLCITELVCKSEGGVIVQGMEWIWVKPWSFLWPNQRFKPISCHLGMSHGHGMRQCLASPVSNLEKVWVFYWDRMKMSLGQKNEGTVL